MKIGLNCERLLQKDPAGPEVYTYNLINALAKIDYQNSYFLYFDDAPSKAFFDKLTAGNSNFISHAVKRTLSWTQLSLVPALLKDKIDVFFTSVHTLPLAAIPFMRTVIMVHGFEYVYSEEHMKDLFVRHFKSGKHEWFISTFSNRIIVPSNYVKKTLLEKYKLFVPDKKVSVIYEGVDAQFYKRDAHEMKEVCDKYNLYDSPYLIFVSTIQPRKNIPAMINAFALALAENISLRNVKLAIVGKKGWMYEESLAAPSKYDITDNVLFLGRVSDEGFASLLSGARAFINCSFDEGFGLSLLEALACECACIVSDISAFKEIGGDLPRYVDPGNVPSIQSAIEHVLTTQKDLSTGIKARARAQEFTWEKTARETLSVFESFGKNL